MNALNMGFCRAEDYHLWFGAVKESFLAFAFILAILFAGIAFYCYKRMSEEVFLDIRCRKEEEEACDNWPNIPPGICPREGSCEPAYPDFEKNGTKISLEDEGPCEEELVCPHSL